MRPPRWMPHGRGDRDPTLESSLHAMTALMHDLRYTLRQLRLSPGFTAIVVLTLALGIGANSLLFGIVNAAMLRPLPYPHSERIVSVSLMGKGPMGKGNDMEVIDEPTARALQSQPPRAFDALALYEGDAATLAGAGAPEHVTGGRVSGRFFRVMGVSPSLGREFTADELMRGGPPAIVLSTQLWARDLGSDPHILGKPIQLDERSYTVVGIMPAGFSYPAKAEYWLPLVPEPAANGVVFFTYLVGRLRSEVSIETGRAELAALRQALGAVVPASMRDGELRVMSLHERLYGDLRAPLLILLGTVGCVLLIACANVANLLLARASSRRKELALRTALGATRSRIIRQLLMESLVLALTGGTIGLLLPIYGLHIFTAVGPDTLTRVPGIEVNGGVLAFTLAVAVITGLLFGLAPALTVSRGRLQEALKDGTTRLGGTSADGPRRALVAGELALAILLLIGAGLLVKSFLRFQSVDPGFRAEGVLTASISLPRVRYPDSVSQNAFFDDVLQRTRALAGVASAAITGVTPLGGFQMSSALPAASRGGEVGNDAPRFAEDAVGTDYFRTFGIRILSGRAFTAADDGGAPKVAVISERLAQLLFAGKPAIGQSLALVPGGPFTVVGVSANVRQIGTEAVPLPTMYTALRQSGASPYQVIALRAQPGRDASSLIPSLRNVVKGVDPNVAVGRPRSMEQVLSESIAPRRFNALLLGAFAMLALLLATIGLYGVIAYLVARRTHEIGIRMALGAERRDVLALVLRQGMALTLAGVLLGVIAAFALTRIVSRMLFRVDTHDPVIFVAVPLFLVVVSVLAMLLPARRAARVDPVIALRSD